MVRQPLWVPCRHCYARIVLVSAGPAAPCWVAQKGTGDALFCVVGLLWHEPMPTIKTGH